MGRSPARGSEGDAMSAKVRQLQATISSGELDPQLTMRENVEAYYKGVERLRNAVPLPQGGGRRRYGLRHRYTLLTRSIAVNLAPVTITAPQGGTAANAKDGDDTTAVAATGNISAATPYVLLHADFGGSVIAVAAVDLINIRVADTLPQSVQFKVQNSSDNAAWTDFGAAFAVTDTLRGLRVGAFDGSPVSRRYWRVVKTAAGGPAKPAQIGEMRMWQGTSGIVSNAKKIPFVANDDAVYLLELTEHNLRVYKNGAAQADLPSPFTHDQVLDVTWAQSQDTLILYHKDVPTWRVFRLGSDTNWSSAPEVLTNVPDYDFGDTGGGVNHVFRLTLSGNYASGLSVALELDGETTDDIPYHPDQTTMAGRIRDALKRLKNLYYDAAATEPGIVVTAASAFSFSITLNGPNGRRVWGRMSSTAIGINGAAGWAYVETLTEGAPPREPVMSGARGWPRCGCFYAQRQWKGGFRSLTNAVAYSVAGDPFNLDNRLTRATSGAAITADTDRGLTVRHLFPGRHLIAFTSAAEFYHPSVVVETPKVGLNETTKHGCAARVRPQEVDGQVLFAQEGANVIRSFVYSDAEQTYNSSNASLLASHLIRSPAAAAYRRGRTTDEGNIYMVVNGDGTLAVFTSLRDEGVAAWSLITTGQASGKFLDVAVDEAGTIWATVERTINGTTHRRTESFEPGTVLDAHAVVTSGLPAQTFSGLTHLANQSVHVIADGAWRGTATVNGSGQVTIPGGNATTRVEIGVDDGQFMVRSMPLKAPLPDGTILAMQKRVVNMTFSFNGGSSFNLKANDGASDPVAVAAGFVGEIDVEGLMGWTKTGQFEITQPQPLPFQWRGILLDVAHQR
jgi:hypothetical protein